MTAFPPKKMFLVVFFKVHSVLGPTIFLIYINDLLDLDIKSNVFLFADDVKLYNVSSENHFLASDLNLISEWSAKWQLSMSVEKCCVLHLGRHTSARGAARCRVKNRRALKCGTA